MPIRLSAVVLATLAALVALTALAPAARAAEGDPYAAILTYELGEGQSRKPMAAIEEEIRAATPEQSAAIEGKLLKALTNPRATYGCKQWVCRMLRRIGTDNCVPALSKLLADKQLAHMARFALQHMPGEKAASALRAALTRAGGDLKIGLISSLGTRRDRQAVPALAKLVSSAHAATAEAAISALGQIGGAEAVKALQAATVAKTLEPLRADAVLMGADAILAEGDATGAAAIYRQMAAEGSPVLVRLAAFRGLVLADKEKAIPTILPLMKDKNEQLQRAVGSFLTEMPGPAVTKVLAEQLPTLPPGGQLVVLGALETRADKTAAPAVAKAVESKDDAVRIAAVKALATLGDASSVDVLTRAAVAETDVGKAATEALGRLSGEGVAQAVVKMLDASEPGVRAKAVEVVALRKEAAALPAAMKATADADAGVRVAAIKALGVLAGGNELPKLIDLLVAAQTDGERAALEQTVASAAGRTPGSEQTAPIAAALPKAATPAKASLMTVLARVGGDAAMKAVQGQLTAPDAEVKKAAIRALAEWKDASPMPVLLNVAKTDASAANQVLALRGYIRMVSAAEPGRADEASTKMLAQAMTIAKRPEEKKAALAALPKFACDEALKLAESCQRTPGLEAEAAQAVKAIRSALVTTKMRVSAEPNNGAARNAVDGNSGTRWDSGRPMKPGDWFAMDLGAKVTVRSIFLDNNPSSQDWPRTWEVYVSEDGKNWGRPIAKGKGSGQGTKITLTRPVQARHLKIVQTGSSDSWHWSIHTMRLETE